MNNTCKFMLALYSTLLFAGFGCVVKVYPEERLQIAPQFLNIFNSITQRDTFSFKNLKGYRKIFIITKVDSVELNEKGWFTNGSPYKMLRVRFREIGVDTTILYRNNEINVSRAPDVYKNGISIQFSNFYYNDTFLVLTSNNSFDLNGKKISKYYSLKTPLILKNQNDVQELYISPIEGIIGYKTLSKEIWINERL